MQSTTSAPAVTSKPSVRLPTHVVPKRYQVHLLPDLSAFSFLGKVEIRVDVSENVPKEFEHIIVLHAEELKFDASQVVLMDVGMMNFDHAACYE